jgi:hypothetical protein
MAPSPETLPERPWGRYRPAGPWRVGDFSCWVAFRPSPAQWPEVLQPDLPRVAGALAAGGPHRGWRSTDRTAMRRERHRRCQA